MNPIDWSWPAMIHTRVIHTQSVHAHERDAANHAARRLIVAPVSGTRVAGPRRGSGRRRRRDAVVIGMRTSGVAMRPWRVQHALEHRGVRLGEAGLDHREERFGVRGGRRRACPPRPHSTIATNRPVHTCADAVMLPTAPMQTSGKSERVVAAQHAEAARRRRRALQRVGVERRHRLLDAGDVRDRRPARAARPRRDRGPVREGML